MATTARPGEDDDLPLVARRHLVCGWWAVFVFLLLGSALEILHGYKVDWYLDVDNSMRRLMLTLAHAHGTLLGILNVIFGLSLRQLPWKARSRSVASAALLGSTVLLPGGFLLGGVVIYAGDPGLGILLVPVGALALLVAVTLTARTALRMPRS